MPTVDCPNCEADVIITESDESGDTIECEGCNTDLEIVSLNPPELEVIEEDTYDDEDDEDEY